MEIAGPEGGGKTEVALRFISEAEKTRVAWIEDRLTIYPCAFLKSQIDLRRVLFVESPESDSGSEILWAANQILRSQVFGIVVIGEGSFTETELRRLQLAAEKSKVSVIMLRGAPSRQGLWPISTQIEVHRTPDRQLSIQVLKHRLISNWGSIPLSGQKAWEKLGLINIG